MYVVVSGEQLVFTLHCGFVVSWLITCVLLDFCVCLCVCVCVCARVCVRVHARRHVRMSILTLPGC